MGWLKALFGREKESEREFVRLNYARWLSRSNNASQLERSLEASTLTLKVWYGTVGLADLSYEQCLYEAIPFAFMGDAAAEALVKYALARKELDVCFDMDTSYDTAWLQQQINYALKKLLTSDEPEAVSIRSNMTEIRPGWVLWVNWINEENSILAQELSAQLRSEH